VHLPELALLPGGERGLGGEGGVLVERQGVVLEDDADLAAVGLLDLLQRRADAGAERALEFAELDDRDGRLRVALDGVRGLDLDIIDLGVVLGGAGAAADLGGRAVLGELGVDGAAGGALRDEVLRLLELFVDDLLEGLEGLGADQVAAVDVEVRGAAGADGGGEGLVALDLLLEVPPSRSALNLPCSGRSPARTSRGSRA
jgi:hypothetical protein